MKYKISDLAKMLDMSTNTIRRYENMGYIDSERNEENNYRYYNDTDLIKLMDVKFMRKYGFSHEDIAQINQADISGIKEIYLKRLDEMDRELAYLKALRHRLKDDYQFLERIETMDDFMEMNCVAVVYVAFKEGDKMLTEKKRQETVQEFMTKAPELHRVFVIDKNEPDKRAKVKYAWAVKDIHMDLFGISENEYTVRYESKPSLFGIIKIPLNSKNNFSEYDWSYDELKEKWMPKYFDYIKEHDYRIDGDIMGVIMTKCMEQDNQYLYVLVTIPVAKNK